MKTVIQLQKIRKQYGNNLAVQDISLDIYAGEIFGIVGPNGAGKTTLIEIVEGLRKADSGSVTVLGQDIRRHPQAIKHRIGVLLQLTSIPERARVKEIMQLFSSFYNKTTDLTKLGQFLGLQDKQQAVFKTLSGGWKQRVALALALINDPDIVFLDEPSMGLDPHARAEMWELILALKEQGKTIIVTTHYMEEAEKLCDRVAIIDKGQVIALDSPRKLVTQLAGARRIGFRNTGLVSEDQLRELPHVSEIDWQGDWITLYSGSPDHTLQALYRLADRDNWMISGLQLEDLSMNDVFRELTSQGKAVSA